MRKTGIMILLMLLFLQPMRVNATEAAVEMTIENEGSVETKEPRTTEGLGTEGEPGTTEDPGTKEEADIEEETETIAASELDLGDYTEQMTVGEKQLLSVTVLPLNAGETAFTYSSSDTKIATINGMGRITALAIGSTTITVTAGQISQSFELRVVEAEDTTISVTNIEIAEYEPELEVGKTMILSGTVLPTDATKSTITYTSSDMSVATVSATGEVKGISAGNVTITLTAGGISKTAELIVKVATTGITLNNDYLILKPDETFQLSAKVTPADAPQAVSYKSTDTSIATVSPGGCVTGKKTGTTTIIVSNGDSSVAVSVIVNQAVNYNQQEQDMEENTDKEVFYADTVLASEQNTIDAQMLKHLYETKQLLKIVGDGYIIEIDGKDIVNYNNEIYTDISIKRESDAVSFVLNKGNELCGAVTLFLEEPEGKYLYLYNESKEKYEQIDTATLDELKLTTAGTYQIRETKLKWDMKMVLYIIVGGVVVLLIGVGVYITTKKKYWFW